MIHPTTKAAGEARSEAAPAGAIERSVVDPAVSRALPNLVVVGAMKCGTSSFHEYLDAHPSIAMSRPKELDFFLDDPPGHWHQGVQWYASHFDADSQVRGEASPNYAKAPMFPHVPARMHALLPDAKLIYLVRDPIERVLSHYVHNVTAGREHRPIGQALAEFGGNWYIGCSRYGLQAQEFLAHYGPDQLLILQAEELRRDTPRVMSEAYRFLGVDQDFSSPRFGKIRNPTSVRGEPTRLGRALAPVIPDRFERGIRAVPLLGRRLFTPEPKPVLDAALRARLVEELAPDVALLRSFAGREFPGWSV